MRARGVAIARNFDLAVGSRDGFVALGMSRALTPALSRAAKEVTLGGEREREQKAKCSYWQASQVSGFSSEHASASAGLAAGAATVPPTVAVAIRVAGRERR